MTRSKINTINVCEIKYIQYVEIEIFNNVKQIFFFNQEIKL